MNTQTPTTKSVTPAPARTVAPTPAVSYFDGSTLGLIGWSILAYLIITVTLGLGTPWAICLILKWQTGHTVVNSQRLRFTGSGGSLFLRWILWTLLTIITFGIYIIFATVDFEKWKAEHTVSSADRKSKPPIKSKKFLFILIPIILIAEIVGFIFLYNRVLTNVDWFPTVPYIEIDELKGESSTTAKRPVTAKSNSNKEDMVTIVMPEPMVSFLDSEFDYGDFSYSNEDGIEIVKNKDGSYTYTMTRKIHDTLLKDMKQSLDKSANNIINENAYSNLIDIQYNDDFTEVYLYFDILENDNLFYEYLSDWGNMFDGFSITRLAIAVSYYQLFNGVNPDDIDTSYIYIYEQTGDELYRFNYSELDIFS